MPEENKNPNPNQPKEPEEVELVRAATNTSVQTTLILMHSFLTTAVNTKIKDGNKLREPTATEVFSIVLDLMATAVNNLQKASGIAVEPQTAPEEEKKEDNPNANN